MTRPLVPEVPESFNAATFFVDRHLAEGRGGRVAFRYRGARVTWADLADEVAQRAPAAERRRDCSSLRLCVSSGEALPPVIFHAWKARFGHELVDVLGSTEALHDFIANRPGQARPGAAGRPVPGFQARLVDDRGQPVPPGSVGHLLIKGPTTSPYYWNRYERTKETMLGEWLRTGDMGYEDSDGYFYFCGRSDDMVKVGGLWVSPLEVETQLLEHKLRRFRLRAGEVASTRS